MNNKCPVCGKANIKTVFKLKNIPFAENCLYDNIEDAKNAGCGIVNIALCEYCGFVFNSEFNPQNVVYNTEYHSERINSDYFNNWLKESIKEIDTCGSLKGKTILEAACNTGEFMKETLRYKPEKYIGVDPSINGVSEEFIARRELFDENYLKKYDERIDLIINRHMIEHIEDPLKMLELFWRALDKGGLLYLETPRLDWILKNKVFFDFNYEHCSYFTDDFIKRLLKAAGFKIAELKPTYGDQYFFIIAEADKKINEIEPASEQELQRAARAFEKLESIYLKLKENFAKEHGTYLWGGSAKGVIFANVLNSENIGGIIDINPNKQGKYIPGAAIKIISPQEITYDNVKRIIVMNGIYLEEITAQVKEIDPRINVKVFEIR